MWHEVGRLQHWLSHEIWALGRDTFHFGAWAIGTFVPTYVKAITDPLGLAARALTKAARAAEGEISHLARTTSIPFAHQWRWISRHWKPFVLAVALAPTIPLRLPHTLAHLRKEIHGLTKRNLRIQKRLHRLEKLFYVSTMAAVMANVLGLPNWRCLTRGNIGRAARHFCGLDKWLVDLLLLGSVETFVATDLCEFTHLLGIAAKAEQPALLDLVKVENVLIGCHGTVKPLTFKLPPADLPPLQGVSPLAA
jgi:hypothetical protein